MRDAERQEKEEERYIERMGRDTERQEESGSERRRELERQTWGGYRERWGRDTE